MTETEKPDAHTAEALDLTEVYSNVPRIRDLLEASDFDGIVSVWHENTGYLSGFYHPDMRLTWERLHIVVWPSGGEPVYIVPRARATNWNGLPSPTWAVDETRPFINDIRGYDGEHLDMVRVIAEVLVEKGISSGLIGVEFRVLPMKISSELSRLLPQIRYADAWPLLNDVRKVKTDKEVKLITRLNQLTARTIEQVMSEVHAGETDYMVASRISQKLLEKGADELSHTVFGGACRAGQWHPWPSPSPLEEGTLVRIDWGIRKHGYTSDIGRTAVVGTASAQQRDKFYRISEVHDLVVDAIRPGVMSGDLVELARKSYERLGLEFRWPIVGHSIGRVLHEAPHLTSEYNEPLVEGMTLEIELGWVDSQEGYHLEDLVYVGADETVNLTRPADAPRLIEKGTHDGAAHGLADSWIS
jgi:Xaa-Pro aminopeptidase